MKKISLVLMLFLFLSSTACAGFTQPEPYTWPENEFGPSGVSQDLSQKELEELFESLTTDCPEYDGTYMETLLVLANVSDSEREAAAVNICQSNKLINDGTLMVVAVATIPAFIEPTFLGEATVGGIYIGGRLTAVILVHGMLGIALAGSIFGDVILDELSAPALPPSMLSWDPENSPESIPDEVVNDIAGPRHHALLREHVTAKCTAWLAGKVTPHKVYWSANALNKGVDVPSVLFAWNVDRMMKEISDGDFGNCSDIDELITQEYSDGRSNPGRQVYLILIMRQNKFGLRELVAITAYPVVVDLFPAHLCEWNYTLQLYPVVKPICGGPPL